MKKSKLKPSEWIEKLAREKSLKFRDHCGAKSCGCFWNSARFEAILDYLDQQIEDRIVPTKCKRHKWSYIQLGTNITQVCRVCKFSKKRT